MRSSGGKEFLALFEAAPPPLPPTLHLELGSINGLAASAITLCEVSSLQAAEVAVFRDIRTSRIKKPGRENTHTSSRNTHIPGS